jgi:phosphonate transport system substrate-binding protein
MTRTTVAWARVLSLAGFAAIALTGCGRSDAETATIRVTGIPDENPTELAREYAPMVDLLEAKLGVRVEYVPVTDYGAAVQGLVAGMVDFAWLGGFTHVQARSMTDVVPLAMRDIDRQFQSVLVAHVDGGVTTPADLRGKTFAFGSKSSTSGHLMPRHFLRTEFGIDSEHDFAGAPVYSGAHDATAKMVESGKVAAGALNMQVWDRMVETGAVDPARVRVIWKTPPYVDYVWTARTAVPETTRNRFKETFLGLDPANPQHRIVLDRMGAERYVPASASDFDAIERVARETGLLR